MGEQDERDTTRNPEDSKHPHTWPRHLRFSTEGVDLRDDASVEAFAARVWRATMDAWTGDDVSTHTATAPAVQLGARFADAVTYASTWHATHARKGTTIPYISHLLGVASLVLEAGGTEDEAIAGLLHDVAEDCGGEARLTEIREQFGPDVERIVRACSDSLTEDPDAKAPWRERKEAHLRHLVDAEPDVVLVTACDKLHNARAILADLQVHGVSTLRRFNAPPRGLAWYYASMLQVLAWKSAPRTLLVQFAEAVTGIVNAIGVDASPRRARGRISASTTEGTATRPTVTQPPLPLPGVPSANETQVLTRAELLAYEPGDRTEAATSESYARGTAAELLALLPGAGCTGIGDEASWRIDVRVAGNTVVAQCDITGAFCGAPNWRVRTWSGVKEGGPEQVARSMSRDIQTSLDTPDWGRIGLDARWFDEHANGAAR